MSDSRVETSQVGGHSDVSGLPVSLPTPDHAEVLHVMINALSEAMAIDPLQMHVFERVEQHVAMVAEQLGLLRGFMESSCTDVERCRELAADAHLSLLDLSYGLRKAISEAPFAERPPAVH